MEREKRELPVEYEEDKQNLCVDWWCRIDLMMLRERRSISRIPILGRGCNTAIDTEPSFVFLPISNQYTALYLLIGRVPTRFQSDSLNSDQLYGFG